MKYEIVVSSYFDDDDLKSVNKYKIRRKYWLFDTYFHDNRDNNFLKTLIRVLSILFFVPVPFIALFSSIPIGISLFYLVKYSEKYTCGGYNELKTAEDIKNNIIKHKMSNKANIVISETTIKNNIISIEKH